MTHVPHGAMQCMSRESLASVRIRRGVSSQSDNPSVSPSVRPRLPAACRQHALRVRARAARMPARAWFLQGALQALLLVLLVLVDTWAGATVVRGAACSCVT